MSPAQITKTKLLTFLSLFSLAFMLWQVVFILSVSNMIDNLRFVIRFNKITFPESTWIAIAYYCGIQLLLYILLTLIIWSITRLSAITLKLSWQNTCRFGFATWVLAAIAILFANQIYFPNSAFAQFSATFISPFLAKIILIIILLILGITTCIASITFFNFIWKKNVFTKLSLTALLSFCAFMIFYTTKPKTPTHITSNQPNVIIIGLDSLRPTDIGHYNQHKKTTATLDNFLRNSTTFTGAITTLGRTFVAWGSILTGQYPKHNNIRFNLTSQDNLYLKNTLAAILKNKGYQTIYASDDTRFSNITTKFGFDKIVGTRPGINEILLSSINDFPLSNLLINSSLGEILFPYSYANREAYMTYLPSTFLNLLNRQLYSIRNQPLFLSIHLCLPHYPYLWALLPAEKYSTERELYNSTLKDLDKQFASLLQILQNHHLLNNTIVVVLSDHGAALQLKDDRLIKPENYLAGQNSHKHLFAKITNVSDKHDIGLSTGHGTDVLSYTQLNTLLAFRYFKPQTNTPRDINLPVSLIDIKPTILDILDIPVDTTDGISLRRYIEGENPITPPRMLFTETGLVSSAEVASRLSIKDIIKQQVKVFSTDLKSGRIIIRPHLIPSLLLTKQRAVYYKNWVLALYPGIGNQQIPILVERNTGTWTDDLHIDFAKHAPIKEMLHAINAFYGKEITDKQLSKGIV